MLFSRRPRTSSPPRHRSADGTGAEGAEVEHQGADDGWGAALDRAREEQDAEAERAAAEAARPTDEEMGETARQLIREMTAQTDERRWLLDGDVPYPELPYHLLDGLPEAESAAPAVPTLLDRRAKRNAERFGSGGPEAATGGKSQ